MVPVVSGDCVSGAKRRAAQDLDRSRYRPSRRAPHRRTQQRQPLLQPERLHRRRQEDGLHHARGHLAFDLADPRSAQVSGEGHACASSSPGTRRRTSTTRKGGRRSSPPTWTRWSTREIAKLPARGSVATVNADETLLAGTYIEGDGQDFAVRNPPPGRRPARRRSGQIQHLEQPRNKGQMMEQRLAAHLPMAHVHHQRRRPAK